MGGGGWKERPEGRGTTDRRRDGEVAGRRRGRNSGETRVREGAGEHVEGNVEGGDGGDVHLILPPTGLERMAGVGISSARCRSPTITVMGGEAIWLHYFGTLC